MTTISLDVETETGDHNGSALSAILKKDNDLHDRFRERFETDVALSRSLVSYQASKSAVPDRSYCFTEVLTSVMGA